MIDNIVVGKKIAEMRQERSLTQQQLASIMNVSHQAVSKWESGATLPDIQTMLRLTEFFGITVERLLETNHMEKTDTTDQKDRNDEYNPNVAKEEVMTMNVMQLLQMAPFMTKEAVEDIALRFEGLSANEIAKLAPYLLPSGVKRLIEKNAPVFNWDVLKKIAPYMSKEDVDALARSIADGETTVNASQQAEDFNKTINDIGKAFGDIGKGMGETFDDIGKGVEHVVKKAIRFGGNVIKDVSAAINDISENINRAQERSEKAAEVRKKAFERALADEKWDWISKHLSEIENDSELMRAIAEKAKECNMHSWIREHISNFADETTVNNAIENDEWTWLGENAWRFETDVQERIIRIALEAKNWQWIAEYSDLMNLEACAKEIAERAMKDEAIEVCCQIAHMHMKSEDVADLIRKAYSNDALDDVEKLCAAADIETISEMAYAFAESNEWKKIEPLLDKLGGTEIIVDLTQKAVDCGDFEAIDMLEKYL